MKPVSLSKIIIGLIFVYLIVTTANLQQYRQSVIRWDVVSYYAYLPAAFIYNDLKLEYAAKPEFTGSVWHLRTEDGTPIIKTTMGLAILYSPFFFIAHGLSLTLDGYDANGYTIIYSLFLILSNFFYTIIGFVFLRKLLLKYFNDKITAFVILSVFFSTNLLFYTLFEVMAHSYLFAFINMLLYYIIEWHNKPKTKYSILIGLLFGIIILTRPTHILLILLFMLYNVYSIETLKNKVELFISNWRSLIIMAIFGFLVLSIQFVYWKYISGSWLYWSYTGESFFWTKPHIVEGLFGFRKGWYLYMPIMLPATIGLFLMKKIDKKWSLVLPFFWMLFTYIILCWWSWWYGGGFSIRPYIDIYGIMGLGLGAFIKITLESIQSKKIRELIIAILIIFSFYGAFTSFQYYQGAIHHDSMTRESWKDTFLKTHPAGTYWEDLKSPDYEKAIKTGEE
jgi:hypothetical protein